MSTLWETRPFLHGSWQPLTLQWSARSHRGNAPLWPQGTAKKASPVLFVSILEFDLTETLEAKGLACAFKQDPKTTDVTWSYIFFFFFFQSKWSCLSFFTKVRASSFSSSCCKTANETGCSPTSRGHHETVEKRNWSKQALPQALRFHVMMFNHSN